jgi:hypothetical protein
MKLVKITCPKTWFEKVNWIYDNCDHYIDSTNWGMWQIGQEDIYLLLEDYDAAFFRLKFGENP